VWEVGRARAALVEGEHVRLDHLSECARVHAHSTALVVSVCNKISVSRLWTPQLK